MIEGWSRPACRAGGPAATSTLSMPWRMMRPPGRIPGSAAASPTGTGFTSALPTSHPRHHVCLVPGGADLELRPAAVGGGPLVRDALEVEMNEDDPLANHRHASRKCSGAHAVDGMRSSGRANGNPSVPMDTLAFPRHTRHTFPP